MKKTEGKKMSKKDREKNENEGVRIRWCASRIEEICQEAGLSMRCQLQHNQYAIQPVIKFDTISDGTLAECRAAYVNAKVEEEKARIEMEQATLSIQEDDAVE